MKKLLKQEIQIRTLNEDLRLANFIAVSFGIALILATFKISHMQNEIDNQELWIETAVQHNSKCPSFIKERYADKPSDEG